MTWISNVLEKRSDKCLSELKTQTSTNTSVFSHIEQCKICQNHNNIFDCFDVSKFYKNRNILLAVVVIMIENIKPSFIIN